MITEDIRRGLIPESISSFSDLHDFIDTNLYLVDDNITPRLGSFFNWSEFWLDDEGIEIDIYAVHQLLNLMFEALDYWLENGRKMNAAEYLNIKDT